MNVTRRFWYDEGGAEMVEWAVVTIILLVATVPALMVMREGLLDMFRQVFEAVQKEPPATY